MYRAYKRQSAWVAAGGGSISASLYRLNCRCPIRETNVSYIKDLLAPSTPTTEIRFPSVFARLLYSPPPSTTPLTPSLSLCLLISSIPRRPSHVHTDSHVFAGPRAQKVLLLPGRYRCQTLDIKEPLSYSFSDLRTGISLIRLNQRQSNLCVALYTRLRGTLLISGGTRRMDLLPTRILWQGLS